MARKGEPLRFGIVGDGEINENWWYEMKDNRPEFRGGCTILITAGTILWGEGKNEGL